jgi:hypothetical protein
MPMDHQDQGAHERARRALGRRSGRHAGVEVFDLELPLDEAGAGYEAMDERRAIKVLLRP